LLGAGAPLPHLTYSAWSRPRRRFYFQPRQEIIQRRRIRRLACFPAKKESGAPRKKARLNYDDALYRKGFWAASSFAAAAMMCDQTLYDLGRIDTVDDFLDRGRRLWRYDSLLLWRPILALAWIGETN
jgi:hypothetical protein